MKARALTAVILSAAILELAAWWVQTTPLSSWQARYLGGWNYAVHLLFFLPLLIVLFDRRSARVYGLTSAAWRRDLAIGSLLGLPMIVMPIGADLLAHHLSPDPAALRFLTSTLVFQIVFVGVGEEVLYRGWMQGTLNRAFGRAGRFGGLCFGPGLFIVCILFGAAHLLNLLNPFLGRYTLSWGWFLSAAGLGLLFGLIKELTGSIIAPVMVHIATNLYPALFNRCPIGDAAQTASYSLCIFVSIWLLMSGPKAPMEAKASQDDLSRVGEIT